jgi:2-keto-3-deoxy-L-fuconate dehydrogenase
VFARPNLVAYATSKGAVLQMGRAMAADLVDRGIRVNVVCPGSCDTPMQTGFIERSADPAATLAALSNTPMGRRGTASEVAQATLYFASDESSYCTGAHLMVDGGRTAIG